MRESKHDFKVAPPTATANIPKYDPAKPTREFLSIAEVCYRLNCSPRSVYKLFERKRLKKSLLLGKPLIAVTEYERFCRSLEAGHESSLKGPEKRGKYPRNREDNGKAQATADATC